MEDTSLTLIKYIGNHEFRNVYSIHTADVQNKRRLEGGIQDSPRRKFEWRKIVTEKDTVARSSSNKGSQHKVMKVIAYTLKSVSI